MSDTRLGEQQPSEERERPIDDRVPAGRGPPDGTRGEMMTDAKELLAYDREHEGHERFAFAAEVEGLGPVGNGAGSRDELHRVGGRDEGQDLRAEPRGWVGWWWGGEWGDGGGVGGSPRQDRVWEMARTSRFVKVRQG